MILGGDETRLVFGFDAFCQHVRLHGRRKMANGGSQHKSFRFSCHVGYKWASYP